MRIFIYFQRALAMVLLDCCIGSDLRRALCIRNGPEDKGVENLLLHLFVT